jgi:hypothetical protein
MWICFPGLTTLMQLDYITLEVLTEGLNMYQKASTCDRRSQLIIITGSVVLLASIVSILVVKLEFG